MIRSLGSSRPSHYTSHLTPLLLALLVSGACSNKLDGPAPTLGANGTQALLPALVCGDQLTTELRLSGARFSPVPVNVPKEPAIALPSLTLARASLLDGSAGNVLAVSYNGDPTAPLNTAELTWDDQQTMKVTIHQSLEIDGAKARIPAGIYDARLRNPNGRQALATKALAVVDKPELHKTMPSLLCLAETGRDLALSGTSFLRIGSSLPELRVGTSSSVFSVSALSDCSAIAQPGSDAELCAGARVSLPKEGLEPGLHPLTLVNPETAACRSEEEVALRIVPAPTISAVVPDSACRLDAQQKLIIRGTGFLQVDSLLPTVRLGQAVLKVNALTECEDLETPELTVKSCAQLELTADVSMFPAGDIAVELTNPEPAGCSARATGVFRVVGPPTIASIAPSEICSDVATTFTVTGSGFDRGASAAVDAVAGAVTFVSATQLQVSVPGVSVGPHSLTVSNGGSCTVTLPAALVADPSPIVFFVDPPTVYGDVPVEVTIFTSGLATSATKVELVREAGTVRQNLTFNSATTPNKILAQVPAGLASAAWDVVVTNAGGCPGTLPGGLNIGRTLTDTLLSAIKPSYASTSEDTAVTLTGAGLVAVPRVYLSPASGSGSARALRAVEVAASGSTLTAVIPSGLAPGTYDLIVVNPDGKIDVLRAGVTITSDKPPVVSAVTPASLPSNATNASVTIAGTGFKTGLSVELDCQTSSGTRTTVQTTELAPSIDGTSVSVTLTMSSAAPVAIDAGSVCLVRLANSDGAFFEYSALSVTNSSLNLAPWKSAPQLTTARRALSLVAGRPTASSRFLYAVGGDNGVSNTPNNVGSNVFDSIEASQVDVFGGMGNFSLQRNRLPAARTGAGAAAIGRFVYVLGGRDGSAASNTLYRAAILDPLVGPELTDLDATLSDGSKGLTKGLYFYRVAALKTSSNLDNPGGETLAGELLPVQLPERAERIALTLKWAQVAGAHGYRIYRSPQANAAADNLELLGEIACGAADGTCDCSADPTRCSFRDEGVATTTGRTPMPVGSLGVWHAVSGSRCTAGDCLLASAREGLVVTTVQNPANANQWFLYAFGGRNQSGTYLDTYEVATVTIASDGSQTVADFAAGTDTLAVPRADLGVWAMNRANSNVIASSGTPSDVWLYVGGGRTTGGSTNNTLEAGKLGANGILNAFVATDSLSGALVGFGTGASNDQLYTFGGIAGAADGTSARLCDGSGACGPLPDLRPGAFNALGSATTLRLYTGSTQESAFFFVAGGHDGSAALTTVQRTVQ